MSRIEEEVEEQDVQAEEAQEEGAPDSALLLYAVTSQTPWWIVSVLLHGLVITLAGLISASMDIGDDTPANVVVTELLPRQELKGREPDKPNVDYTAPLKTSRDIPATDPTAAEPGEVLVPPDVLAEAELGDHFVTNNPDKPDTDSAFGREDCHVFYSRTGVDDAAGGGGMGGSCLEDLIGVGGGASPGTGGGWGGGNGRGMGPDDGPGLGTFGRRDGGGRRWMVKRFCRSTAPVDAVDLGLHWLAYHQEADGHWDAKKYSADVKTDTACTGFALLAFLGAGHTERSGAYKGNVQRAVAWLKSKQDADGLLWDINDDQAHHRAKGYPGAIATLALVEAAGMACIPDTKSAAQKAIRYCTEKHQQGEGSERGGWRYAPKSPGDLSVTGWYIMALKSAKMARLDVDPAAFSGAIKFLDSVEKKDAGPGSGYGPPSHYWYMPDNEHAFTAHRLGAIGNLARQFLGWKRDELQASVEWFVNKGGVPEYGANGEKVDLYYWYYGSMCLFQQGGDIFERWNKAMLGVLVPNQCKQGDDAGSWNPAGDYSTEWGRVGQTALSCLCLEVYYRYKQLQGSPTN